MTKSRSSENVAISACSTFERDYIVDENVF